MCFCYVWWKPLESVSLLFEDKNQTGDFPIAAKYQNITTKPVVQLCCGSHDEEVEFHDFSFYHICLYTTPTVSCHCPAHSTCPMRKLLLMPTQQKRDHTAVHNGRSWERVKQTRHPSDKDCDSLILWEGRQCPNEGAASQVKTPSLKLVLPHRWVIYGVDSVAYVCSSLASSPSVENAWSAVIWLVIKKNAEQDFASAECL